MRASASPSWPTSLCRASAYWLRRSTLGATDSPSTCSIRNPAVSNRPPVESKSRGRATGTPERAAASTTPYSTSSSVNDCPPGGSRRSTQRPASPSTSHVSREAPPGIGVMLTSPGSWPVASATAARTPSAAGASAAIRWRHAVALIVAGGDVRGVLVPVPRARIVVEILRRVRGIDREPDPADRQQLVHERAVGAVEREAVAAVAPLVGLVGEAPAVLAVAAESPESLAGPARVHRERELLVVLVDLEHAGLWPDSAGRVGAPRRRERLRDLAAVRRRDRLHRPAPAALEAPLPRLLDPAIPQPLVHKRDQPRDPVDQQVVHELRLVLHLLAEPLRLVAVAALDRLDRALHRRARHLAELLIAEPPLAHCQPPSRLHRRSPAYPRDRGAIGGAARAVAA